LQDSALSAKPLDSMLETKPLAADVSTGSGQGVRLRMAGGAPPPDLSGPQVAEMQKRLAAYNAAKHQSDEQANREFNKIRQAINQAPADNGAPPMANAQPGAPAPVDLGGKAIGERTQQVIQGNAAGPQRPGQLDRTGNYAPSVARAEPVEVNSFTSGLPPGELSEMLGGGERLMKQGKFQSALDQYEEAARKYPASPLVALGRANAELGASYYAKAERDLREAFAARPELLLGKYNLKQFLGTDRLNFLVNDLKEISNAEIKEPRPVFLLAYIMYHTGNPTEAAKYLDLAERRTGRPDPVFKLIREHWALPDANKPQDKTNAKPAATDVGPGPIR